MAEVPGNRVVCGRFTKGGGRLTRPNLVCFTTLGFPLGTGCSRGLWVMVFGTPESDSALSPLDVPLQSPRCRPAQYTQKPHIQQKVT